VNGDEGALVSDVLTYKGSDGVIYETYRNFTVKIALTSTRHNVVPRVKDIRAIALT